MVNKYGRQLLWAQAIAANEKPTAAVITAKQNAYTGIAASLKQNEPGVYPLFQGKQWTTRLEIGFAALFAALAAGLLVLFIAITLIILKLGFLLLLVAGPFFLIIGTHPGFGRVIALRWAEMLIGVLLKTAAIALVLSVLLYAYSLIMGASDAALPWALKILMIALVTVAVFIYRKPFGHLFSAVGYGVIGSRERAEASLAAAGSSRAAEHGRRRDGGGSRVRRLPGGPVGAAQPGAGGQPGRGGGHRRHGRGAGRGRGGRGSRRRRIQRVQRADSQRLWPAERRHRPGRHTAGGLGLPGQGGRPGPGPGRGDRQQRRGPDPSAAEAPVQGRRVRATAGVQLGARRDRPGQAPLAGYRTPARAFRRAAAAGRQRRLRRAQGPGPGSGGAILVGQRRALHPLTRAGCRAGQLDPAATGCPPGTGPPAAGHGPPRRAGRPRRPRRNSPARRARPARSGSARSAAGSSSRPWT